MENIDFILWMILYPIGCSIVSYISSKELKLINKEPYTDTVKASSALINIIIWVAVGINLYGV